MSTQRVEIEPEEGASYCNKKGFRCRFLELEKMHCRLYNEVVEYGDTYAMKNREKHFGGEKPIVRCDVCMKEEMRKRVFWE